MFLIKSALSSESEIVRCQNIEKKTVGGLEVEWVEEVVAVEWENYARWKLYANLRHQRRLGHHDQDYHDRYSRRNHHDRRNPPPRN